ncbi:MAG: hypothetical protein E6Q40_01360 [Cupriavidus sp.]|nr:MAG: hypothetical protein E6Q40_01360 [Cupriavidus sp.]
MLGNVEKVDSEYKFTFRPQKDLDYWRLHFEPTGTDISGNMEIRLKSMNQTMIYATSPSASQEYLEPGKERTAFLGPAAEVVNRARTIMLNRTPPGTTDIEVTIKVFGSDAGRGLPFKVSMVHEPKPL